MVLPENSKLPKSPNQSTTVAFGDSTNFNTLSVISKNLSTPANEARAASVDGNMPSMENAEDSSVDLEEVDVETSEKEAKRGWEKQIRYRNKGRFAKRVADTLPSTENGEASSVDLKEVDVETSEKEAKRGWEKKIQYRNKGRFAKRVADTLPSTENAEASLVDLEEAGVEMEAGKKATKQKPKKPIRQPIDKKETFKMLQFLLEKSNIFAELVLKRMQDEEEQRTKSTKSAGSQEEEAEPSNPRRRTRKVADVKYAEFFDKEELKAKRTRYSTDDVPDLKTAKQTGAGHSMEPEQSSNGQPELFSGGVLRSYQLEGLEWLKAQYDFGINGILADEMGLGKTVQVIALICHLYSRGVPGPFLIAAPLSTIPNWLSEFERFAPLIPVVLLHGSKEERTKLHYEIEKTRKAPWNGKKILPVVMTTYEMVITNCHFLSNFEWKHFIIDEAQRVKNFRCRLMQKCKLLTSKARLLLTGTPVQNNLEELWSMLNFLVPDVFADLEWFESLFGEEAVHNGCANSDAISGLVQKEEEDQMLTKLHKILAPFLLRRLKSDVELELPKKKEVLVYAPMTPLQAKYYKAGVEKIIVGLFREDKSGPWKPFPDGVRLRSDKQQIPVEEESHGSVMQNLNCVKASMVLFRKIAMHPYLLENPMVPGTKDQFLIDEDLVFKSGKMLVLDRLLVALKERGHKILLFSTMTQMMDILMDYCQLRNFDFCRLDGTMSLEDRQIEIKRFNEDQACFIFMISTRAGGVGLNLMAADTVIIFDSHWNPQVDLQAQDRCHRIGQTKPVIVYRLVTRGTIDDRIIDRATAKRRLEKIVIHSGKFKQLTKEQVRNVVPMSKEELKKLLESTDYSEYWEQKTMGTEVISDQDLERLLDRTALMASPPNTGEDTVEDHGAFRVLA